MPEAPRVVAIHAAAPPKPAEGAPCNGCGVCCLVEPCPIGMLVSRRRHGACAALRWSDAEARYLCGVLVAPREHVPRVLRSAAWLDGLAARWVRRVIAAGAGCDCSVAVEALPR